MNSIFKNPLIYLAGGTAIALHLGHRISEDLDFFVSGQKYNIEENITVPLMKTGLTIDFESRSENTLVAYVGKQEGKISCFNLEDHFNIENPIIFNSIRVAGIKDLLAMKLLAIIQRGRLRDFLDLWAIEQQTAFNVEEGINFMQVRFPSAAPHEMMGNVLLGLNYFENARKDKMPKLLNCNVSKLELEKYWSKRVGSIENKLLNL